MWKSMGFECSKISHCFSSAQAGAGAENRGHCADMHTLREVSFPALGRIFWSLYRLALGKRRISPLQRGENNLFTRHSKRFKDQCNFCSLLWLLMRTVIMVIWEKDCSERVL